MKSKKEEREEKKIQQVLMTKQKNDTLHYAWGTVTLEVLFSETIVSNSLYLIGTYMQKMGIYQTVKYYYSLGF